MQHSPWHPILPLGDISYQDIRVDLDWLDNAKASWDRTKSQLDPDITRGFTDDLYRSVAVETGIIEGLYDLDRGVTQTLVAVGFTKDAVERAGESVPESTLSMLRDHLGGLDFIMDYIGGTRSFTTAYIRELHALVTASQTTSEAISQVGHKTEIEMRHGNYKRLPNNPLTPQGVVHEYTPVEQVAVQMDELVRLFQDIDADEHSVTKAAWLHHRFTQIHPFQDGNGRVARLLASMVLIKGGYFPFHIRRDDRDGYFEALELADAGRLEPLIKLTAWRLHEDILSAVFKVGEDAEKQMPAGGDARSLTQDVAALVAARRQRDQSEILEQRRQVNKFAMEDLLPHLVVTIENRLNEANTEFNKLAVPFEHWVDSGGAHDGRGHWWGYQNCENSTGTQISSKYVRE